MNTKQSLHAALMSIAQKDFDTAAQLLAPVLQAKSAKIVEGKKEKDEDEDEEHDDDSVNKFEKSKFKKKEKDC